MKLRFGLTIGVDVALEISGARLPVKRRRELTLRPRGVLLPEEAEGVERVVWQRYRQEATGLLLIAAQEFATCWKVVVDDVESTTISLISV